MKILKKLVIILFFILLVSSVPFINGNAKTLTGTLYSRPSSEPVIDGYLNDASWSSGIWQEFTIYKHGNVSDTMRIEVVSTYSEYDHLYFGFNLYDDNFMGTEILVMFLQKNETGDLVLFNDPLNPYLQNGNDAKGMYLGSNTSIDLFTQLNTFDAYFDDHISVGGDNNMDAKSHVESSELITIEFETLFHTTDLPICSDIDVDVGDKVNLFFWYLDNTGYYSGYIFNTTNYEYGILDIGGTPPVDVGFTMTTILISIISVNLIVILRAKKNKK
jgi:hypothetical protein